MKYRTSRNLPHALYKLLCRTAFPGLAHGGGVKPDKPLDKVAPAPVDPSGLAHLPLSGFSAPT